jgi:hypothetical protein
MVVGDTLRQALDFHRAGRLSLWPLPVGCKWDDTRWKAWQIEPQTEKDVMALFGNGPANIAVLYGKASYGLFGPDCDTPTEFIEQTTWLDALGIVTWVVQSNTVTGNHASGGTFLLRAPVPVQSSGSVRGQIPHQVRGRGGAGRVSHSGRLRV